MNDVINEFSGGYRFLSNFWSCYVTYEGMEYPSVENAYQAAKCADVKDRVRFLNIKASEAKKLGRVIKMREGWNDIRVDVMMDLVRQKFTNDPVLRRKLLATGNAGIEEGNWWGDTFWGTVNGVGENHLGEILMLVRAGLRETQQGV